MSSKLLDPHGPTHSTRRGRQALSAAGDSNFLYKLIMSFNLVMTFVTACANEHIVENPSTASTGSPAQTGDQKIQNTDDGIRMAAYAFFIIVYILSAVAVIVLNFVMSDESDKEKKNFRFIADSFLFLAGILYLSGDNILLLHRRFETKIWGTEARDVRSYLVAISLALMIISRIIPYIMNLMEDYGKPSSETLEVSYNCKNKTWEIWVPGGYHPKWKTDQNWLFKEKIDIPSAPQKYLSDIDLRELKQIIHVFATKELVSESQEDIIEAKVRLIEVHGEFIPRTEIDINIIVKKKIEKKYESQILSLKGTSPVTNVSHSWKSTFHITQFTADNEDQLLQPSENPVQARVPHKTAMIFSFGVYVNLIDYTLIADALYTTVLDEITHQDRNITEGYDCPEGHKTVALVIWCLLTLAWFTAVIFVPTKLFLSRRYECIGSWKDFKGRLLFIEPELVPKIILRKIHGFLPELKQIQKIRQNKKDQKTVTDQNPHQNESFENSREPENNLQPDTNNRNYCNALCRCTMKVALYATIILLFLANAIALYIISFVIAGMFHCRKFFWGLVIVAIIAVIFFAGGVTVIFIYFCYQKKCSDTCSGGGDTRSGGGDTHSGGGDTRSGGGDTRSGGGDTRSGGGDTRSGGGDTHSGGGNTCYGSDGSTTRSGSDGTRSGSDGTRSGSDGTRSSSDGTCFGSNDTNSGSDGTCPGSDGTRSDSDGTRSSSDGTHSGSDGTRSGSDGTRSGSDGTRSGSDGTHSGSDGTCFGSDGTHSGSDGTCPGSDGTRSGSDGTRSGSDGTHSGSDGIRSGSDGTRSGSDGIRSGSDGTRSGSDGTRSGSDGTHSGSDGTCFGSDDTHSGSDGTRSGSDGTCSSSDGTRKCSVLKCEKHKNLCFQGLMGFIFLIGTAILILYFPMYLVADNKFPWVCFLSSNDREPWVNARYALLFLSFLCTIPFTSYQLITTKVKPFLSKENYDDEELLSTRRQHKTLQTQTGSDSS